LFTRRWPVASREKKALVPRFVLWRRVEKSGRKHDQRSIVQIRPTQGGVSGVYQPEFLVGLSWAVSIVFSRPGCRGVTHVGSSSSVWRPEALHRARGPRQHEARRVMREKKTDHLRLVPRIARSSPASRSQGSPRAPDDAPDPRRPLWSSVPGSACQVPRSPWLRFIAGRPSYLGAFARPRTPLPSSDRSTARASPPNNRSAALVSFGHPWRSRLGKQRVG
jgi:hypothetical protein